MDKTAVTQVGRISHAFLRRLTFVVFTDHAERNLLVVCYSRPLMTWMISIEHDLCRFFGDRCTEIAWRDITIDRCERPGLRGSGSGAMSLLSCFLSGLIISLCRKERFNIWVFLLSRGRCSRSGRSFTSYGSAEGSFLFRRSSGIAGFARQGHEC